MNDIITIGDCMRDIFIFPSVEEMEKPVEGEDLAVSPREKYDEYLVFGLGDKITVSDVEYSVGGTATNVAVSLKKIGLKASVITAIGGDATGDELRANLAENKIDDSHIKVYKSKKSSFSVIVSYKGNRTIFVYHAFGPDNFHIPDDVDTQWIYLGPMANGYERLYNQLVNLTVKNGLKIAVNPGSVQIEQGLHTFGGLLKLTNIMFLNRQEAQKISGLPGIATVRDMAKEIQATGPKVVVITDGPNGAYAYNGIDFLKVGAYPGHCVDATGAGDAFASAFLAAFLNEHNLQSCLKWGVTNAASVVGEIGTQKGLLTKKAIEKRILDYHWPAESLRFS